MPNSQVWSVCSVPVSQDGAGVMGKMEWQRVRKRRWGLTLAWYPKCGRQIEEDEWQSGGADRQGVERC